MPNIPINVNAKVALAINGKYKELGEQGGVLGPASGGISACPDGIGYYQHFANGSIYWSPSTGANEVHGAIQGLWASMGWERSPLGYPESDETGTPDGVGRYNHFQHGSIYWTPSTGAHEVRGAIQGLWASKGWERSPLGYPETDETGTPDGVGRYNHFQHGSIYWTPETGAHDIQGAIRDLWASKGWERSYLGYPVSDDHACPAGRCSDFKHGSISWSAAAGARDTPKSRTYEKVTGPIGAWDGDWTSKLTIRADGSWTLQAYVHNATVFPLKVAIAWALPAAGSNYAFGVSGSAFAAGEVSDFRPPDQTGSLQLIADKWDAFPEPDPNGPPRPDITSGPDLGLIESVVQRVIDQWQYIGPVVTVVAVAL